MMAEMARPKSRLVPYGLILGAGLCFSIYKPVSLQATTDAVQSVFHLTLLLGSIVAIAGAVSARERIELAGLIVVVGPLFAYTCLLVGLAKVAGLPQGFALLGIACMFASGITFLMLFGRVLWREIKADNAARAAGHE